MRNATLIGSALVMVLGLATGAAAKGEDGAATLGSEGRPVLADMPPGQHAYLNRLRCEDGNAPTYQRVGNVGPGTDGHIVDFYAVDCTGSEPARTGVYMDMYHEGHIEEEPVPGFTIVSG